MQYAHNPNGLCLYASRLSGIQFPAESDLAIYPSPYFLPNLFWREPVVQVFHKPDTLPDAEAVSKHRQKLTQSTDPNLQNLPLVSSFLDPPSNTQGVLPLCQLSETNSQYRYSHHFKSVVQDATWITPIISWRFTLASAKNSNTGWLLTTIQALWNSLAFPLLFVPLLPMLHSLLQAHVISSAISTL